MENSSRSCGCIFWIIIIVAITGWYFLSGTSNNSSNSSGSNSQTNRDASLTAQALPQNGAILNGTSDGSAGIEISAPSGASAYAKIKTSSGNTVVGFFIRSGSTAQVNVPPGIYSVQFATGETWYGKSDCFGSGTSYGQDKDVSLGYGDVMTYRLQRSSGGNFSPDSLKASDF